MTYSYKGFESSVSIIDLPDLPTSKVIKQYIKTAEKAINTEIKLKEDGENKFKKELKQKQIELDEMRRFVNSRSVDQLLLLRMRKSGSGIARRISCS